MNFREAYRILDRRFTVETNVEKAAALIDGLYRHHRDTEQSEPTGIYRLTMQERAPDGKPVWHLHSPDGRTWSMDSAQRALYVTEATICEDVFSLLHDHYALHGALVHGPCGGLLISGVSGAGKTTLSLGLHASGMTIAGDDLALLDAATGLVGAAPRCFHLDDATVTMLRGAGLALPQDGLDYGFVVPGDLGDADQQPARVTFAFLLDTERRSQPVIEPLSQSHMAVALLKETGLSRRSNMESAIAIADMVAHCRCFRVCSGSLTDTIAAIRRIVIPSTAEA